MEFFRKLFDFVLHIDQHLLELVQNYGSTTYLILFAIIFAETGLVVAPFLPGDSLFFAAGAICASGSLSYWVVLILCIIAGILGNTVNYAIGRKVGPAIFKSNNNRWIKKENLDKAHDFYEKYGARAIVLGRFLPFFRTFVPFIAGIAAMDPWKHFLYNVLGAVLWVGSFVTLGYFFGRMPAVKENFSLVILGILVVTAIPPIISFLRRNKKSK